MTSKSSMYNYFKENSLLQEEEKVLKEMLGKFQDQLNRLKIEELALMSLLKMQEQQSKQPDKLTPAKGSIRSLDSISDTASVTSVIPVGLMVYENSALVNKEYLDLDVNVQNLPGNHFINDFDEEEEEEEDDIGDMEEDEEMFE